MLVMAAAPASGLAGSASGSHPRRSTNHGKQRSVRVGHAGALVLALGSGYASRSGAVRVLQRRLTRAGYAPGPIDGRYGPRTEQAVRRLQTAHGLLVDGIAGPRTLASLGRSSVVLYPGAGYAGRGSGAVRALQHRLRRAGYAPGPIDGRYGPRTEQAVRRFQATHGLVVDGIAGPQTVGRLAIERMPHKAARRSRPANRHQRANRPARRGRSHPQPDAASPRHAPAPRKALSPTHSTSSRSLPLVELLVVLVAVGLWATWLAYRRHTKHSAGVDPQPRAEHPDPAAATPTHRSRTATARRPAVPNGDRTGPDAAQRAFSDAVVLEEQGDLAAAAATYRRADQLGHGAAACNLGVLLVEQGDHAGAGDCFRRADQRGEPAGAFNLAVVLEEQGETIEALRAYQRAAQLGDRETAERARSAMHDLRRRIERSSARTGGDPDDS
jgi:peptidoglycan hydrolase-like protein with peptidoglycan-binding domain